MSEMNTDKNLPCSRRESGVGRVKYSEPIELFTTPAVPSTIRRRRRSYYPALLRLCKLACLFLAFAALFYALLGDKTPSESATESTTAADKEAAARPPPSVDSAVKEEATHDFVFLDESGRGVNVRDVNTETYTLAPLVESSSDVRVIILHSHSSERVAENVGVAAFGEKLCERLNEAGIGAFHCTDKLDKNGVIGAYDNMKTRLEALKGTYPKAVLLIDLHSSDVGDGATLTVGAHDGDGWTENLTLALAVCRRMQLDGCALRLLPSAVGQDNGMLSIHLGIGGDDKEVESSSAALDAFIKAILEMCKR